ncbi:glyoxylase I, partial [Teratosphaeria destructans]
MLSSATKRLTALTPQLTRSHATTTTTTAKMTDPTKYKFNHTMLRIKDPKRSVAFYEHLGMSVIEKKTFPDNNFDLYFLAYASPHSASGTNHWTDREGILELTHNYGTEDDPTYKPHNGNRPPQGFGH